MVYKVIWETTTFEKPYQLRRSRFQISVDDPLSIIPVNVMMSHVGRALF